MTFIKPCEFCISKSYLKETTEICLFKRGDKNGHSVLIIKIGLTFFQTLRKLQIERKIYKKGFEPQERHRQ